MRKPIQSTAANSPLAWFYVVIEGERRDDPSMVAEAVEELRRLGYEVGRRGWAAGAGICGCGAPAGWPPGDVDEEGRPVCERCAGGRS